MSGIIIDAPYYLTSTGLFSMKFSPIKLNDVGIHLFKVKISDGLDTSTEYFTLKITNSNPYFVKEKPQNLEIKFNNSYHYILPPFIDDENNAIDIIIISAPEAL